MNRPRLAGFEVTGDKYMQENDAKYEQANDKLPFISRIEIKALSQEVKLIVKGFDPEREPLDA